MNSVSMYESSGSQFFKTTTRIQPQLDNFDDWRFVMTFLTILGVTEILCNFRLVLEENTGKEMQFLANNFALSDAENNTSVPLNTGGTADLPLLKTILVIRQKSWQPHFWYVMGSFVLSVYASWQLQEPFCNDY